MEKKIVKIVWSDGSTNEISSSEIGVTESDSRDDVILKKIKWYRQFNSIEKEVLNSISDDIVSDYAIYNLDLVDPNDCGCNCSLFDYSDDEISEDYNSRNYLYNNMVTEDLRNRFMSVLNNKKWSDIDDLITKLENL